MPKQIEPIDHDKGQPCKCGYCTPEGAARIEMQDKLGKIILTAINDAIKNGVTPAEAVGILYGIITASSLASHMDYVVRSTESKSEENSFGA